MFKFPTMYDERSRVHCDSGNAMKKVFKPSIGDDGVLDLVEDGQESLYDYIQSWKDSVDINVILARYANGDVDALSKVQGAYGDFTQFPRTYAEILNRVNQGKLMFDELPLPLREKYNNDFCQFMAAMDRDDFWEQFKLPDAAGDADGDGGNVNES